MYDNRCAEVSRSWDDITKPMDRVQMTLSGWSRQAVCVDMYTTQIHVVVLWGYEKYGRADFPLANVLRSRDPEMTSTNQWTVYR